MTVWLLLSDGSKVRVIEWSADLHMLIVSVKFGPYNRFIKRLWVM